MRGIFAKVEACSTEQVSSVNKRSPVSVMETLLFTRDTVTQESTTAKLNKSSTVMFMPLRSIPVKTVFFIINNA